LTKNGPIEFAPSWSESLEKSLDNYGDEKTGGSLTFFDPEDACKGALLSLNATG
jgi:hypothetical protein